MEPERSGVHPGTLQYFAAKAVLPGGAGVCAIPALAHPDREGAYLGDAQRELRRAAGAKHLLLQARADRESEDRRSLPGQRNSAGRSESEWACAAQRLSCSQRE